MTNVCSSSNHTFQELLINQKIIDWLVLLAFWRQPYRHNLSWQLTYAEFESTIGELMNHTAPGLNTVTAKP